MRSTLSALVVAAGILGFGAAAQAAPLATSMQAGASADSNVVHVQMDRMERHEMRRHMRHRMERHEMRRHMHHRMERRHMRHEMMRHHM